MKLITRCIAITLMASLSAAGAGFTDTLRSVKDLERAGKAAEARPPLEELLRDSTLGTDQRALALMELSRLDLPDGRYARAVEEGGRAVALFRRTRNHVEEGNALTVTGVAHIYAGEYAAALSDSAAALKIARATGDAANEVTRLNNIGNVYYFEGRYADALNQYNAAMAVVEAHPDEKWNVSRRQLTAANLASLYQRLGRYDRALNSYTALRQSHAALTISEQAQLLANMGSLYRRLGDPLKALETYGAARQLFRKEQLRTGEIAVLNNIGIAQALDLHRLPEALISFEQALRMAETSRDKRGALHATLYRAETLFRLGRTGESTEDFTKAATLASSLDAIEEKWKALYGLARTALKTGDSRRSASLLREAITLIESLRAAGPTTLRGGFLADKRQVYDLLIGQLARTDRPPVQELFRLMELSRARTLQDRKSVGVNLARIQQLLSSDTILLEYWVGDESLAVVWATSLKAGVIWRNAGPKFRTRLSSFSPRLKEPGNNEWKHEADTIAEDLLGGAGAALAAPGIRNVIVVPDREIAGIPFEVLPLRSRGVGRLVDAFAVSYLPAASLLRRPSAHRQVLPFWSRSLLAFADPSPGNGNAILDLQTENAGRLPAAPEEIRDAAAFVGGKGALFTGANALKSNLYANLRPAFPIVHFATHAFSDPEDPARSFILFAPPKTSQAWDYLFLNEIGSLDLNGVDLVTVSACDTESGKLIEGEGVNSFSRAFLSSGARAVVTTLWPVGDRPTADLMRMFYRNLAAGATAARALRDAKSEFARTRSGHFEHPFYWAAFVVNGDADVRIPLVISGTQMAAAALFVAAICAFGWSFRTKARKASKSVQHRLHSIP